MYNIYIIFCHLSLKKVDNTRRLTAETAEGEHILGTGLHFFSFCLKYKSTRPSPNIEEALIYDFKRLVPLETKLYTDMEDRNPKDLMVQSQLL